MTGFLDWPGAERDDEKMISLVASHSIQGIKTYPSHRAQSPRVFLPQDPGLWRTRKGQDMRTPWLRSVVKMQFVFSPFAGVKFSDRDRMSNGTEGNHAMRPWFGGRALREQVR